MTSPLPPVAQDTSVVEAQRIRSDLVPQMRSYRENFNLDEISSAQAVVSVWQAANSRIAELYANLQQRRRARLDVLDQLVPLGPPVTPDMALGDRVLTEAAFRAALAQAREATPSTTASGPTNVRALSSQPGTLAAMLADAERFDDDVLRRAVLTAAFESGQMDVVRSWTDLRGVTAQLDEFADLQQAIAGSGIYGGWAFTVFSPIPAPTEESELPRLIAARDAAAQARTEQAVRDRSRGVGYYRTG